MQTLSLKDNRKLSSSAVKTRRLSYFSRRSLTTDLKASRDGSGGALTYESDARVPPSTSDVGVFWWQIASKKGSFCDHGDKAHKNRGSFSEMHQKIGVKMAKNFSHFVKFVEIFEKSIFLPKIVTCLTIKCEKIRGLSVTKDVSGSFGDKEFVKNRGSLGESW